MRQIMRWFFPSTYNIAGLFVIISLLALVLAWNSYGLLMLAMANLDYLHRVVYRS